jgi:multiple sugar transport system ATP-binding protein
MNFLAGDMVADRAPRPGMELGIRPHDVTLVGSGSGDFDAWVDVVEPLGSQLIVYLRLGPGREGAELRAVTPPDLAIEPDTVVGVRLDPSRIHWFDPA